MSEGKIIKPAGLGRPSPWYPLEGELVKERNCPRATTITQAPHVAGGQVVGMASTPQYAPCNARCALFVPDPEWQPGDQPVRGECASVIASQSAMLVNDLVIELKETALAFMPGIEVGTNAAAKELEKEAAKVENEPLNETESTA